MDSEELDRLRHRAEDIMAFIEECDEDVYERFCNVFALVTEGQYDPSYLGDILRAFVSNGHAVPWVSKIEALVRDGGPVDRHLVQEIALEVQAESNRRMPF